MSVSALDKKALFSKDGRRKAALPCRRRQERSFPAASGIPVRLASAPLPCADFREREQRRISPRRARPAHNHRNGSRQAAAHTRLEENMKNILIISASPRKGGNSELLCESFMKGALEAGHKVEIVRLREHDLHPCFGCEACQATHACVQKDGMAPLLDKLLAADVVVMATPVYFYSMNAQMKTFIDRTLPHYTEISGKEFYFIATAADSNRSALERTIEGFRGFTDCLEKPQEKGVLLAPGVWKKGDVASSPAMEQAFAMGRNA